VGFVEHVVLLTVITLIIRTLESSNGAWGMTLTINLQLQTLEMNKILC